MKNLLIILLLAVSLTSSAKSKTHIQNDCFWYTTDGQPMFTNGGGIFRFQDPLTGEEHYYWYGVKYQETVDYVPKALGGSGDNITHFLSVTCYRSDDLINWTFENDIVTNSTLPGFGWWLGRCGVAYVKEQKKYALFIQYNDVVGVFTCDTPGGNYSFHQNIDMKSKISTTNTGDQTVFTDDDGQSYLCYSKANGRNRMYISKIGVTSDGKIGLLDCNKIYEGSGREGNCMFKYKDKYYVCASDLYGWNASNLYFLSSDNIYGPYKPTNSMTKMAGAEGDYGHVTQTGCFYTVRGTEEETVIACGDRWAGFAGNGNGFSQWCPVSFDDGTPYFNSLSHWTIDHKTGRWSVGPYNNYAVNWSFDADRVSIPSNSKPSQAYLRGWTTEIIAGNKLTTGASGSPVLNAKNSKTDREAVMGNFAMNITDRIAFKRKIYQKISSTKRVELKEGYYNLTAMANCGEGFNDIRMYAVNPENPDMYSYTSIIPTGGNWEIIDLSMIKVIGGSIEIGFTADGNAGSQCRIDDVELTFVEPLDDTQTEISIIVPDSTESIEYYTLEGIRLSHPRSGLNIVVRKQNGNQVTTKEYYRN